MTNPPPLTASLDKARDEAISRLFETLITNLMAPVYSQDKSTPIERFERGFKLVLEAYDQALGVIQKEVSK